METPSANIPLDELHDLIKALNQLDIGGNLQQVAAYWHHVGLLKCHYKKAEAEAYLSHKQRLGSSGTS